MSTSLTAFMATSYFCHINMPYGAASLDERLVSFFAREKGIWWL